MRKYFKMRMNYETSNKVENVFTVLIVAPIKKWRMGVKIGRLSRIKQSRGKIFFLYFTTSNNYLE